MNKKLSVVMALAVPLWAFASSNCDKPINNFDGLYCLNKVYAEADKELNDKYKELSSLLDASGKASLKKGQLDWMSQRNGNCSRSEGDNFYVNLRCATQLTIERAEFLQSRVRECKSSGCMNSKL